MCTASTEEEPGARDVVAAEDGAVLGTLAPWVRSGKVEAEGRRKQGELAIRRCLGSL